MYELENISWSWMFLLIVLISIFFIIDRVWKNRTQKSFFSKTNLERLSPNISEIKPILKIVSVIVGVSMLIIALINPKIGTKIETFQRLGVDIVFAIDVSKSMLAEDISPSRMDKSKQLVGQVINNLGGDRIGIVAYAGKAFPQLPLTTDYSSAKMFLQNMNTDMLSSQVLLLMKLSDYLLLILIKTSQQSGYYLLFQMERIIMIYLMKWQT